MNTILVPDFSVNGQTLSSSAKPANVTAHVPPTGVIRNGGTLLKTLENIWFIFNKEGYFCAGNDYLARKVKVAESTVGRALSRLQELGAVQIILYPGLLREIKPLISVAELRTLMSGLLASFLRSVSPILLSPVSEIAEIAKLTNRNESVPVPSPVVGSLALQKEKDSEKTPNPKPGATMATDCRGVRAAKLSVEGTYFPKQNSNAKGVPAITNESDTPRPQAVSVVNTARAKAQTPSLVRDVPLDLPAAAAQLVTEGKVTEGFAASVLAKAEPDVLRLAIAAARERESKGDLQTWEGFLRRAVSLKWRPNTPPAGLATACDDPRAIPARFKGFPDIVNEWERCLSRHLKGVPLERYPNLMERAVGRLTKIGRYISPDTLCEFMALAHGFDMEGVK